MELRNEMADIPRDIRFGLMDIRNELLNLRHEVANLMPLLANLQPQLVETIGSQQWTNVGNEDIGHLVLAAVSQLQETKGVSTG